jgi:hypothetical protein
VDIEHCINYNPSEIRAPLGKGRIISPGYRFMLGEGNIHIICDWGWEEIPQDVLTCLVMLCEGNIEIIDNIDDNLTHATGPYESETIGNYKYIIKKRYNTVTGDPINTTGNIGVDQILDKYVKRYFIGVV